MGPKAYVFSNDRTMHIKGLVGEQRIFYYSVFNNAELIDESQIKEAPFDVAVQIDFKDKKKCSIVFKVKSENDALLFLSYPFMRENDKFTDKMAELAVEIKDDKQVSLNRYLYLKTRSPAFYSRVKMSISIDNVHNFSHIFF